MNVHVMLCHAPRPVRAEKIAPTAASATADPKRVRTNRFTVTPRPLIDRIYKGFCDIPRPRAEPRLALGVFARAGAARFPVASACARASVARRRTLFSSERRDDLRRPAQHWR